MSEPSVGPLTRGFLFADLRGYTAYAERRGDRAAADLLDRYRALVRTAIAASAGAEIRTEGDSFYVVFPSASAAVGAGLAIVAAAAEAAATDPAAPIRVGVGVHAGEAEERDEGPVGTAVNVAARVCAEAAAGEVLVTDTVRSLVRTGGRYRFSARGSHRLKGLVEPIALYRAEPAAGDGTGGPAEPPRRDRRLLALAGSLVGLVAIVAVGGLVLATRPAGPSPSPSPPEALASASATAGGGASADPSPSPSIASFPNGPIAPGTYQKAGSESTSAIRLTFGDDGWWKALELPNSLWLVNVDLSGELQYNASGPGFAGVVLFRPGIGYVGCSNDETTTLGVQAAEDVIDYLITNPGLVAEVPSATTLAGREGIRVRFQLGPPCGSITHVKPLFQLFTGAETGPDMQVHVLRAFADQVYEVFATEVDGEVFAVWMAAPEDRWDALSRSARSLVNTLEVGP